MALPNTNSDAQSIRRVRYWYAALLLIMGIFVVRLFYVQVIRYDHYKKAALSDQLKQYRIPAERGSILAYQGGKTLPIVLNQTLYTVYADPTFITQPAEVAAKLAPLLGKNSQDLEKLLRTKQTRYVVLAKKIDESQKNNILKLKYAGVGATAVSYRTYPQGSLAAQTLGFVTEDGTGKYGLEQALNKQLSGTPGELKAITDIKGVPLAASGNNIQKPPLNGQDVVTTLDLAMQQQLETILAEAVKSVKAKSASALILDAHTGAVKAMGNMPSYDPSKYYDVSDASLFQNGTVADPIEIGSIMKSLTTAAALDQGVIKPTTSYYDPSFFIVNGFRITNIQEDGGPGRRTIGDILNLSLNTGATWELMQMGGGQLNLTGRKAWHNYMVNHYGFGKLTGIEQGYESGGVVPLPENNGAGIDLTYANTAFGQAMTATPVQVAAALAAVVNGGTYYQPRLVDGYMQPDGSVKKVEPKIVNRQVVKPEVSKAIVPLMQYVVDRHTFSPPFDQSKYTVGGKTGTAQIAKPGGGYYDNEFNGTYLGFVGGDKPQYIIVVFIKYPQVKGYAGTAAAQPVFGALAHMLINGSFVRPKTP